MNARSSTITSILIVLALFLPGATPRSLTARAATALTPRGTCSVTSRQDSGPGTLRACLQTAASGDTITFSTAVFPPTSPAIIALVSVLPDISQGNLTIDASNAGVILDGSLISAPDADGLSINSNGNTISGLQIRKFPRIGIHISTGSANTIGGNSAVGVGPSGQGNVVVENGDAGIYIGYAGGGSNNVITGNRIGTNAAGSIAQGNHNGILLRDGATHNRIGGTTPGERNVISGNRSSGVQIMDPGTANNVVVGNYIGTDLGGTSRLPNGPSGAGVFILQGATNNVIEANLISGNDYAGIEINGAETDNNVVRGNRIGTDASGTSALGNVEKGVFLFEGAKHNRIGGSTPAERNIISGNAGAGVQIEGVDTTNNVVSGNYLGTDVSGLVALPNSPGIFVMGAPRNTIGGSTPGERNVIGDGIHIFDVGADENVVIGNYIGVAANGLTSLETQWNGVGISNGARNNRIGGNTTGERNVISGNADGDGIYLWGSTHGNIIQGNYIGTDASGTITVPNRYDGIGIAEGSTRNVVGGTAAGERNLISGNTGQGIGIYHSGTTSNTILGNYIGVNVDATAPLGNQANGIYIDNASGNIIGGTLPGEGNILSANRGAGVAIAESDSVDNVVSGNTFGTDASGSQALGSQMYAMVLWDGSSRNQIGPGNTMAHHSEGGILIHGAATLGNRITQNSIHNNRGLGIDTMSGGNTELPAPVIAQFTGGNTVAGTACADCAVEIYSDDAEEGRFYEGSTTANAAGQFSFTKAGGFSLANVTATATDAAGNTSEFAAEAPRVPPSITAVTPDQGNNVVPNDIYVAGAHFSSGAAAALSTTPSTSLAVQFIDATQIVAVIPAGIPAGRYHLTVTNPGGGQATVQNAYTVYGPADDDLFGLSSGFWTDPMALRAGQAGGLGLVVHRQGGRSALANVVVRFYRGNPSQGGTVIGDGVIPLLSPNSSVSTPRVNWTPPSAGTYDLYAVIDPANTIPETTKANNVVRRSVSVMGPAADLIAPHVDSFAIDDGAAVTTQPEVTLDAMASDNTGGSGVASLLYLEFEYSQAAGQWHPVQNSGWLPYATAQSNYPWTLPATAGMKYMQAWAADHAGNISLYPYQAYINYVPAIDHVDQGQSRIYRLALTAGQALSVTVTPAAGDPDLYVWPPDFPTRPPWVSNQAFGADVVSFNAPVAGVYQIEVYGYTAADYHISMSAGQMAGALETGAAPAAANKPARTAPVLPVNSVPPTQIALPPAAPPILRIMLPVVFRS